MGKGIIISGGDKGLYSVKLIYARGRCDQAIAELEEKKEKLIENRAVVQSAYDDKSVEVATAYNLLGQTIIDLQNLYLDLQALQDSVSSTRVILREEEAHLIYMQTAEPPYSPEDIADQQALIASIEFDISELLADISDVEKAISAKNNDVVVVETYMTELAFDLAQLEQQLNVIDVQIVAIDKRKDALDNDTPPDKIIAAWCADLTEDIEGTVGTIEIPGELGQKGIVQIYPGYIDPDDADDLINRLIGAEKTITDIQIAVEDLIVEDRPTLNPMPVITDPDIPPRDSEPPGGSGSGSSSISVGVGGLTTEPSEDPDEPTKDPEPIDESEEDPLTGEATMSGTITS